MYRSLTPAEINQLQQQGCSAEDWSQLSVDEAISLQYIRDVHFSGVCKLGKFENSFEMPGGLCKHSGLSHATFHNVTIGDNCCIENIKNYIANYNIESDCYIENVDIILVDGETSFGNGVDVAVLNETGGREVTIHDQLTAHEAYLEAMYRHRPVLIEKLKAMAAKRTAERTSNVGTIGTHSLIVGTSYLKNMYVGPYCKIEGAGRLKNGSLMSRKESPVHIGYGVIADDFIVQDGSHVEDNTTLSRVYVGQACMLGHGYSASDSLFFCNCQEENGEACAIFAGPFTVTHHKSTLLIAGIFSFMNAGSGSNQSNHMYKLGPIHQGALERGAKTASDSYILWPARIGAFSLVMGRHSTNADTSQMPFSYLIEKKGETFIAPAVNLRSVGTVRDAQKWPKRDKRCKEGRLDMVNFNLLSPYTIDKMVHGLEILEHLKSLSGATSDTYSYQSAKISNNSLHRGIELYRIAITKFLGNSLISRLEKITDANGKVNLDRLAPSSTDGLKDWIDIAGLIAPHTLISKLMNDIESGVVASAEEMNARLADIHANYYEYEWTWAYQLMLKFFNLEDGKITLSQLADIVTKWKDAVIGLDKMLYHDAQKEFSLTAQTGFGCDGNDSTTLKDFEQVRGDFESNSFVTAVNEHIANKGALGDKWLAILNA
ncbi:MAG: DUF4954 family protein [Bacteroidales bacterium]|nr:DUF4954 family protein [Candidatus Liminaster caballi]